MNEFTAGEKVARIDERVNAIFDLVTDFRTETRRVSEEQRLILTRHIEEDARTFASIDNRFQGFQNQLTNINDAVLRLEKNFNDFKVSDYATVKSDVSDIKGKVHDEEKNKEWWKAWWALVAYGITLGSTSLSLILKLADII